MKKLFILFLLVALVPFSIGCFGGGDDNDVIDSTPITKTVVMPGSVVADASLRGAVSFSNFALYLNGNKLSATDCVPNGDGKYKVTFSASLPAATVAALVGQSVVAKITTTLGGAETTYAEFTYTPVSSATDDVITVTVDDTTLVVTGVSIVTAGTTVTPTVTVGTADLTAYSFKVASATYGVSDLPNTFGGAITVTTLTPTFSLTFSEAPTNLTSATWELVVSSVDANGTVLQSYTLNTTTDASIFSISADATDTKKASVAVLGSSTNTAKNLENGKTYKVQVSTNNLKAGDKNLDTPAAYFFKVVL